MDVLYPPVAFYFEVVISGISNTNDIAFQEASGVNIELGVEEVTEGGENRFKHKLPLPSKFSNLVLKRGAVPKDSEIITWCKKTLESDFNEPIELKTISLYLLDNNAKHLMGWDFMNAYPVKYAVSNFHSQENALVIETIEFAYQFFTRTI